MRLFTGIDLPAEVANRLRHVLDGFRPLAPLRWSNVENLHITTKFIGEWPEPRLETLRSALSAIPVPRPFTIPVAGFGWFPNPHQPGIFWAGVRAPAELAALARDTDQAAAALGIPQETRPYAPHLTLARLDQKGSPPDLGALRRAIALIEDPDFGQIECRAFHLYLSEPSAGGSRYTKLASYPLEVR